MCMLHVSGFRVASLVLWAIRDAPPALEPMPECATWIGSQAYRCLGVKMSISTFRIPLKIEVWWAARLKMLISLEIFNPGG